MSHQDSLKSVPAPVTESLIMICEKCGKKLAKHADQNPSKEIQQELKGRIREMDGKGKWRAVTVSCMDVCPEDEITIAISQTRAPCGDRFFTTESTDPKVVTELVLREIGVR